MSRYRRVRDREEIELAEVDQLAHRKFGRDETRWTPSQWAAYLDSIATVHADYPRNHPGEMAA